MKPINPYMALLSEIKDYVFKCHYGRKEVESIRFLKTKQPGLWNLNEVHERIFAANQIGYETIVTIDKENLLFSFREKLPEIPYKFKY